MKKYLFVLLICIIYSLTYSQNFNTLSVAEKNQVDKSIEIANIQLAENEIENAGKTYSKIAFIYWKAGRPYDAINNFVTSSELLLQKDKFIEVKTIYSNIGVIYSDIEELDYALEYFYKSLEIRRKTGNKTEISAGMVDVAYLLQVLNSNDEAIKMLNEALNLATDLKNSRLILECYQLLSLNHEETGNLKKANEYAGKAESYQAFLQEQSLKDDFTAEVLRETGEQIEKTQEEKRLAAEILLLQKQLFQTAQDSFSVQIALTEEIDRQRQRDIDFLENQQKLANAQIEQQELIQKQQEAQQAKQQIVILAIAGGLALMLVLAVVMLRANRARKKANTKLEKQNKEIAEKSNLLEVAKKNIEHQNQNITQSINYAKGIQRALLPKIESLNSFIKESFILFRPRDIVSGDFYWFKELDAKSNIFKIFGMHRRQEEENQQKQETKKKFAISAIDCTGHGVPGAFMSMIGYNLLDEITNRGITRPDLILEELHRGVRLQLKQRETNNQDGMDMAICVIDEENKIVEFAGAKNPLVYVENGEVKQIKGSKYAIGGKSDDHGYELHKIEVKGPTWFYMFSDGYIDQFGGDNGRKFMIKRFREMLHAIHSDPLEDQNEFLGNVFTEWMGDHYTQIDDVLVIGFKLDFDD